MCHLSPFDRNDIFLLYRTLLIYVFHDDTKVKPTGSNVCLYTAIDFKKRGYGFGKRIAAKLEKNTESFTIKLFD